MALLAVQTLHTSFRQEPGYSSKATNCSQEHKQISPNAAQGLSFDIAQDLWTLTVLLTLSFHGGTDGDGTLEGHSFDFALQINITTRSHPSCEPLEMLFLVTPQETHFHWQQNQHRLANRDGLVMVGNFPPNSLQDFFY